MLAVPLGGICVSTTDLKVLEQILTEGRSQNAPEMSPDDYFEYFAAEQVLRDL